MTVDLLPGEDHDYVLALGRFIIRWAYAETGLDLANTLIFHHASGASQINPEVPNATDQKIAFFRKAHEQLQDIESLSESGIAIAARFLALKEPRHFLIHGMHIGAGAEAISKVRLNKSVPEEHERTIPLARLNHAVTRKADVRF